MAAWDCGVVVDYLDAGVQYSPTKWFDDCWHKPGDADYDSCLTDDSSEFSHAHTGTGFNFNDSGRTVTAAKCKDYWDVSYSGYTFESAATCAQNCHGYALDRTYWVVNAGRVVNSR